MSRTLVSFAAPEKRAHPHIWGTDELIPKLLDGVFASEAISS